MTMTMRSVCESMRPVVTILAISRPAIPRLFLPPSVDDVTAVIPFPSTLLSLNHHQNATLLCPHQFGFLLLSPHAALRMNGKGKKWHGLHSTLAVVLWTQVHHHFHQRNPRLSSLSLAQNSEERQESKQDSLRTNCLINVEPSPMHITHVPHETKWCL